MLNNKSDHVSKFIMKDILFLTFYTFLSFYKFFIAGKLYSPIND